MSVCPTVSALRFYGCCHPCWIISYWPISSFYTAVIFTRDRQMDDKFESPIPVFKLSYILQVDARLDRSGNYPGNL